MLISGIDENLISTLLAYVGQLFTDLYPLIILVIGLPMGFWIIEQIIDLFSFTEDAGEEFEDEDEDEFFYGERKRRLRA